MVENIDYNELLIRLDKMKSYVSKHVEFPEPSMKLDIESRKDDPNRIFQYLHRQCLLHTEHFRITQQIKGTYLLEGYLDLLKEKNPLAPYLFSRTMLELVAFNYRVMEELTSISNKDIKQWKSKGEQYFKFIVRARFATGDEAKLLLLKDAGNMSKNNLKPINIGECLRSLASNNKYTHLAARYGELCDYVHHNLSSQLICSQGVKVTDNFIHESSGGIVTDKETPYTVYGYPAESKVLKAEKDTIKFMLECSTALVDIVNKLPESVYSQKELVKNTGNKFGVQLTKMPQGVSNPILYLTGKENIGPYDLCPCGSLKKYKFCCAKKI